MYGKSKYQGNKYMITEKIIEDLLKGNASDAVSSTEYLLYEKIKDRLQETKEYIAQTIYNDDNYIEENGKDGPEYKKFFRAALKKFGVSDPEELEGDKKKEFFDYVDNNWESDAEEVTGKDDPSEDDEEKVANIKNNIKKKKEEEEEDE